MLRLADEWLFLRSFLANPLRLASPIASSRRLAQAIAAQVEPSNAPVLELGSGTGSVTEAILDRGVPPSQLVAVESDEDFAHVLRERFKESRIVEGNAFHLEGLLQRIGWEQAFGSIVSGIPILTEPLHVRRAFLCTVMRWLKPHAPFIQFSYGSSPPLPLHDEVRVHHAEKVWEAFVPMHIWVYRVGTATRR